jgi:deazaflavin-dependent oxidoreductase (nitroreductase family)
MAIEGEYEPSPWDMIAAQVSKYEESDGREGAELEGKPCVILWTRGRRSGKIRKTPLMRVTDDGSYAVVASMGGATKSPVWHWNMTEHTDVSLQDGAQLRDYVAHEAKGDEKADWWKKATEVWPDYDNYQASTDRVIPLWVLDPAD